MVPPLGPSWPHSDRDSNRGAAGGRGRWSEEGVLLNMKHEPQSNEEKLVGIQPELVGALELFFRYIYIYSE